MTKINKTPPETRAAIERRSAAMLPDRPTLEGLKPWDIKRALFEAIISGKGASLMGELDRIVDEANEALDKMRIRRGSLTVSASSWTGEEMPRATERVKDIIGLSGFVMFLYPADDETKHQAERSRVSVEIDKTSNGGWYADVVLACEERPSAPLNFKYQVFPTESEEDAIVALVGVDAYGSPEGVDEEAVKALISEEVPEWARAKQKPGYTPEEVKARPATWMPSAEEIGARPNTWTPTATEVGADSAGTAAAKVRNHNEDSGSHTDIRLDITTLRTMLQTVIGTDTGKSMRAVAALVVAEIVGDASDSFDTLEEIAAWIEAHPNDVAAMVKRITELETAMGGKVSKTDIINTLDSTALDKPLSAAMGAKLNTLLAEMSDELDSKATPEQVTKAISDALAGYALKDHNHDGAYAKPSDIPTVPQTLPNPYALTILGKTYNGSSVVSLTVDELIEAIKTASGGVIAWIGDDNNIYLAGNLTDGTYKAYYEVDGNYIEIGELTKGEEETPEPEPDPVTYTIKWLNYDGSVLKTDTVTEGVTPTYDGATPTRAADSEYTYTFSGWDKTVVAAVAAATYTAVYEQTAITPAGPTNLLASAIDTDGSIYNGVGYLTGYRLGGGANGALSGYTVTGYMPAGDGDSFVIRTSNKYGISSSAYSRVALYDKDFNFISGAEIQLVANTLTNAGYTYETGDQGGFTTIDLTNWRKNYSNATYWRMSTTSTCIDSSTVITLNEEIE